MSNSKKPKKVRLEDKNENVSPPWQAWYHPGKQRKFYTNTVTKESIWDHPNTLSLEKSSTKSNREIRKRKDVEPLPTFSGDVERMEVDEPPPPKRKIVTEVEECSSKKFRQSCSTDIFEETKQCSSKNVPSDKILPRVPWSSKVRPFNKLQYFACGVFDTCALLEDPELLIKSVKKQILTVIPYAVLSELDGLKNSEATRSAARSVSTRLKDLQKAKNPYLCVETSVEQQIRIDGYLPNSSVKDDSILNCALRIKKEVLSVSSVFELKDQFIFLVTNDTLLTNKALTHDLTVESVKSFVDRIYGPTKPPSRKNSNNSIRAKSLPVENPTMTEHSETTSEKYFKKAVAVRSIKKQRETSEWIKGMIKPITDQYCSFSQETSTSATKPRPSIPLEDEIVPSAPKSTNTIRSYVPPKPQIKQQSEPSRNRPRMPISLSDDEQGAEDNMDWS